MENELKEAIGAELKAQKQFLDMLARWFYSPLDQAEVDALAQASFENYEGDNPDIVDGMHTIGRMFAKAHSSIRQDLNVDYTGAFYGIVQYEGKVATPYESVFRGEDGLLYQGPHREVFLTYKSEALKLREGIDIPNDHLSFELQFMGLMCEKAADALAADDMPEVQRCLEVLGDFSEKHVLSWIDDLTAQALLVLKLPFYPAALKITKAFVSDMREELADMLAALAE